MTHSEKRLLICSRSHDPRGGVERIIVDLCRELPKRGWTITLGLTAGKRFNSPEAFRKEHGDDLPIIALDGTLGTQRSRQTAIRNAIRATCPDIVLSMRVFDAYPVMAALKQAATATRFAVGIRSYESPYLADLKHLGAVVDYCITSGEMIRQACIQGSEFEADRVKSIGGGIHPPTVPISVRTPRKPLRMLYAGRLDPGQKRILDLIPFVSQLEQAGIPFELHLAGTGTAEIELRAAFREQVASRSILFHGWVDRETLYRSLYPLVDCFVHFAAWEGMTIAPREAMAHGVVPIVSRFKGLRIEGQFVHDETALTFPVGQIAEAVSSVSRLLCEPGLIERLSKNAKQSQQGEYSFSGSMDAWATALEHCLRLPLKIAKIPSRREKLAGRLTSIGIPAGWQSTLRHCLKWPVTHQNAGSEWPTSSGFVTADDEKLFADFGMEPECEDTY